MINFLPVISEGTNGFITFVVEGDPAPEVQWFKGFKDLSVEQRWVRRPTTQSLSVHYKAMQLPCICTTPVFHCAAITTLPCHDLIMVRS
jgi:hypothetical protein